MSTGDGAAGVPFDDLVEMAAIARRHYVDGQTRLSIADELGISRFKVARVLERALRLGVVRIAVDVPAGVDAVASLRLRDRFGLRRAVVVSPPGQEPEGVRDALGAATAVLLADTLTERDVLGLSSGRTIDAVARHLTALPRCPVVQLSGMSGGLHENSVDLVRRVSTVTGGPAQAFYAPLVLGSPEVARMMLRNPDASAAYAAFKRVSVALVAVGSWSPPDSRLHDDLAPGDRAALRRRGVSADVGGRLLDEEGRGVDEIDDRVLAMTLDQLRAVPQVVAVAGGARKVAAVRSVLRSGIAHVLVTDVTVAQALLAAPDDGPRGGERSSEQRA